MSSTDSRDAEGPESPTSARAEDEHLAPGMRAEGDPPARLRRRIVGLVAGVALALAVYFLLPGDLAQPARVVAATAVLMGLWWMTEAIPIPATALLPLILFPALGVAPIDEASPPYANPVIFLFMGGFMLALAMQRWNLHRRIALVTVRAMGTSPKQVVAGFMLATGFLSMWVSNTATAVMMLPIGISVLALVSRFSGTDELADSGVPQTNFGTALMLGIAYAASIGSLSTIIGTPPNTLLVGYMEENHDVSIGFGQWMLVGLPLAVVFLAFCWWLLTHVLFRPEIDEIPGGRELIQDEIHKLGRMSGGESRVLLVFVLAALSWVFVPVIFDEPSVSDEVIAMMAALALFLLPAGAGGGRRLLDWDSAKDLPWGVLLLFGGGLALSSQFTESGLTEWIGQQVGALGALPVVLLVGLVVAGVIFLTELTSNTATAATFLPVAGGVALGLDLDPLLLAIPVALAATCAFMLPVATPPNAIAFGSGYLTIGQMIRGGLWLNVVGVVLITLVAMTTAIWVFGITL